MVKAVILAAGKGTRMKSDKPKVLHTVMDKPMVRWAIEAAEAAGAEKVCAIVGYGADEVKAELKDEVEYAMQLEQLGTGHAVMQAKDFIGQDGDTLILCGDTPLIKGETLKNLIARHNEMGNAVTMLSTILEDPTGYGRIIRDENGEFVKNVEHKDATEEERASKEVNSGMYLFNSAQLYASLSEITNDNAQGEYYLPDCLSVIRAKGGKVDAVVCEDQTEIMGVNSPDQLAEAEEIMKARA